MFFGFNFPQTSVKRKLLSRLKSAKTLFMRASQVSGDIGNEVNNFCSCLMTND